MSWTQRGLGYEPPEIDTSVAHSARVYDYVLGGKDNYPPDREAAEQMLGGWPGLRNSMRQNRKFMHRAVRYLAAERGIRQFLDIGTGIPTAPNLHQIAQEVAPESRIVYVDNDPIVLAHAQARLNGSPEGRIAYVHADLRDSEKVLASPELRAVFEPDEPVALSIVAVLQLFTDDQEVHDLIKRYIQPLPPGSFLVLSTVTADANPQGVGAAVAASRAHGMPARDRTMAEVAALFDGLELIEPGVVLVHRWRPDQDVGVEVRDEDVSMCGGIAVKR